MTNWKEYKLGDLVTFQRGHDLPRTEMIEGIYPVAGSNSIIGFHDKFTTKGIGITIGRSGNIGNPQLHKTNFWAHNTTLYIKEFKKVDPTFFYYLLTTLDFSQLNSGSAVPSLNRNFIHPYVVSIPDDYETQTAIAEILSSLDDKIELNNKINQELENLAQTLFKQWFIDFEFPNQNGDPYKSSGGEIVDSELGEIPKGWEVGSIYDISDVIYGAPFKSKLFNQENKGLPLIRIRDLKTFQPQNWTEEIHPKGTKIYAGDLVVGMDAEFRAHFWLGQPAWLNQRLCHFRPKTTFSKLFVREIIKPQLAFHENSSVGTTVIHLGKGDIDTFKSLIPVNNILLQFEELSNSIFDTIINNSKESQELTKLRNTLLPKLISGELELNNHNF
jgi:type I restriction enzyme S subunit